MISHTPTVVKGRLGKRWWVIALAAVLLVTAAGGGYAAWYQVTTVAVPDVTGQTVDEATAALNGNGLVPGEMVYAPDAAGERGIVLGQEPVAGHRVEPGSAVALTIAGPESLPVPALVGRSVVEAEAAVRQAGFVVGEVAQEFHTSVPAGQVLSQEPAALSQADRDSTVSLVVSKGKDMRTVPELVGRAADEAEAALTDSGLTASRQDVASNTAKGVIVAQAPAAGEQAEVGTVVVMEVSTGPPLVRIPSVTGLFITDAEARLKEAGLVPRDVWRHGPTTGATGPGEIYAQDPRAGAMVPRGSAVRIYTWWESQ